MIIPSGTEPGHGREKKKGEKDRDPRLGERERERDLGFEREGEREGEREVY